MNAMSRTLALTTTILAASTIMLCLPSATAAADPGGCGVTVSSGQDPNANPAAPDFVYLMRNNCDTGANFRVYQFTLGRNAVASNGGGACEWVDAHDTGAFWDPVGDNSWQPLPC